MTASISASLRTGAVNVATDRERESGQYVGKLHANGRCCSLAVWVFMTNSNLLACTTGKSASLLAHAFPQPAELRPESLAAEFALEAGNRLQGRIFPQTCQTLCVPPT
jgi:hypothetical protein